MIEVSVCVVIKENASEGSLISVMESETLMQVAIDPSMTQDQARAAIWAQFFRQMDLRSAAMMQAVQEKVTEQIRVQLERVEDGTNPVMF